MLAYGLIGETRPDVRVIHPENEQSSRCGFTLKVETLGLPHECDLLVRALLETDQRAPLGRIRLRRQLVSAVGYLSDPSPLLVTSLGRTGTTYLMRLLLAHPELIGIDRYPYESRLAGYWAHAMKVLTDPADHQNSAHPDNFQYNRQWVGHNPYYAPGEAATPWLSSSYVERLVLFTQETIREFYLDLAKQAGRPAARHFVEKCNPGVVPRLLSELFPKTKEIFLVRDFRDMLGSILAFNTKRGYAAFGRTEAPSYDKWIASLGESAQRLHADWEARSSESLLIHYENLITKPTETVTQILEYLVVDRSDSTVASLIKVANEDRAEFDMHRTSENAAVSIGRWKRELDPATLKACGDAFGEVLEGFGYG